MLLGGELLVACQLHQSQNMMNEMSALQDGRPPPLPPKKRHSKLALY